MAQLEPPSPYWMSKKDKTIRSMWLLPNLSKNSLKINRFPISILKDIKWGGWALVSLYLSLLSGIVIALQYDYLSPRYSTVSIDLLIPYGHFFRSLHFFSSQFFFLFCSIHLIVTYKKAEKENHLEWIRLITTLPFILLLLLTGYILKGDNTGYSAGMIGENILLSIPLLGPSLNDLLFSLTDNGLVKVYVHHVITLDILLLMLAWNHLYIYRITIGRHLGLLAAIILFTMFVKAPFEPAQLATRYIAGPWFFLGLQELLRYLSPLVAGVIVPGLFFFALLLAHPGKKDAPIILRSIGAWIVFYTILSFITWMR